MYFEKFYYDYLKTQNFKLASCSIFRSISSKFNDIKTKFDWC